MNDVCDPATGATRLLSRPCGTCVMFSDDRPHLECRRAAFVAEVVHADDYVVCHDTIARADVGVQPAICRAYWNEHRADISALMEVDRDATVTEVAPPPMDR